MLGADIRNQPSFSVSPSQIKWRDHEVRLFHYFRSEVAPQLTGLFDQEFWRDGLLRGTQSQPILWYACNAIAATHLLGRTGYDYTQPRPEHQTSDALSLQPYYQYQAALQSMRDLVSLPFVTDTTKINIIVASQLFIVLAMLRGDNMEMMAHYQNTFYACFRADSLFLFMEPPSYKYHSYWEGCTLRLRDDPFISLTEAYFELEPIWNNVVKVTMHPGCESPDFIKDGREFTQQLIEHYKERILKWERKLAYLRMRSCKSQDQSKFAVLDLRAASIKILLDAYVLEVSNICWDASTAAFGKLLDDAKHLIQLRYGAAEGTEIPSVAAAFGATPGLAGRVMTFSPMTNETLYLVARLCRHPILRRRACALLAHDYHLLPSVHTLMYMHLADAQIRLEEDVWRTTTESRPDATNVSLAECNCRRKHSFVCDCHRIYQTSVDEMTTTGAVLHLRTTDEYIHDRPWRTFRLHFNLHEKELTSLASV
ncbi:hypothetical protein V2A60_005911 [Cordyceps javanica]